MMKNVKKILRYLLLATIFIPCLLILCFFISIIPSKLDYYRYQKSCDVSQEVTSLNFAGYIVRVNTNYFVATPRNSGCHSIGYTDSSNQFHAANMTLNIRVPSFDALGANIRQGNKAIEDGLQLRISESHVEHIKPLAFNQFRQRRRNEKVVAFYDVISKEGNLIHYQKTENAFPINPENVYVYYDSEAVKFIIECNRISNIFDCSSQSRELFKGVLFSYHFNEQYILNIVDFDKKVETFARKLFVNAIKN